MDRAEYAVELKHSGYNCCQAVLLAMADKLDADEETLKKIGAAFGIGMGNFEATCGALCAAQMILGIQNYQGKPLLRDARAVLEAFRAKAGATRCADIKGLSTGVTLCSCDDCVRHAVRIAEQLTE